ncbi:MAG TPA: CAP domain-containing protein [Thermoanaerobaculia bacterium]|nr:CAP domain-containing protein [Thermoanaerobaculia bacterium]
MKKTAQWRRFAAAALAMGAVLAMSASAESRPRGGTDLERLAADLARVFGEDAVEIRRGSTGLPRETAAGRSPVRRPEAGARHQEDAIVAEMNAHRAAYGLAPLSLERRLSAAADDRADDMFEEGYFAHIGPDGRSPFLAVTANGYRYRTVGENLAVGYRSARAIVDGWMRSPGHRANILSPDYRDVGIALHDGSPVRGYGGPTVVAMYAAER